MSVFGPVLFLISINIIDVGLNKFISKFADDMKIGNSIITDHDRSTLQEDPRKMPFNVNKCHSLQVCTRNEKSDYEPNSVKLECV